MTNATVWRCPKCHGRNFSVPLPGCKCGWCGYQIPKKSRYFPNDCPIECPYFRRWDMSVDDYTNICVLLKMQIDDCDSDFLKHKCPLESKEG